MHWFWVVQYFISVITLIFNITSVIFTYFDIRKTTVDFMKQRYYLEMIKSLVLIIILLIYIWILHNAGVRVWT